MDPLPALAAIWRPHRLVRRSRRTDFGWCSRLLRSFLLPLLAAGRGFSRYFALEIPLPSLRASPLAPCLPPWHPFASLLGSPCTWATLCPVVGWKAKVGRYRRALGDATHSTVHPPIPCVATEWAGPLRLTWRRPWRRASREALLHPLPWCRPRRTLPLAPRETALLAPLAQPTEKIR